MKAFLRNLFRYPPAKSLLLLALLGTIALVAGLFRGDKQKNAREPSVCISLAIPAGNDKRTTIITEIVNDFMKTHPGVQVRIQDVPGSRYYQKVLVMLASRTGPDIMWMGQSFSEFADRGVFLNLTPYIKKDTDLRLGEYNQQALSWYQYGQDRFAIPFGIDMRIMVYNKDLFDQAGVRYPADEWTFAEFPQICRKLAADTNGDGRIDRYAYQGTLEMCLFGAQVLSEDGSRAACNCPEMTAYLQTNLDLFRKYHVSPTPREQMQQTGLDRFSIFRQNKVAIMLMATWDFPEMKRQFAGMRWDLVLNPSVRRRGQWVSSQAFTIWKETRYPDLCWQLYRRLCGPDLQRQLAFQAIPTHQPTLERTIAEYRGQPSNIAALQRAMDRLYPTPRVPHLQELSALFTNACQGVWTERATPQEAMKRAEHQINRTIEKRKP